MTITLQHGNAWDFIKEIPSQSIDVVITDPEYKDRILLDEFLRICRGNIVMFCNPGKPFFKSDEKLVWRKPSSTKNALNHMSNFEELILVKRQGKVFNAKELHWPNMRGYFEDTLIYKPEHPFEKPLSLLMKLIALLSKPGDTVLDPFMGSGTTGQACWLLERNFIGYEKELKWFLLARKNLSKYQLQSN